MSGHREDRKNSNNETEGNDLFDATTGTFFVAGAQNIYFQFLLLLLLLLLHNRVAESAPHEWRY